MHTQKNTGAASQRIKYSLPQQDGVLVLNKPKGITSAACIARVKHGFSQKKIGHAGTLDPMATGVLLVLLGQATKISGYLMDQGEKVYSGSIRLGITTDTWDAEGTEVTRCSYDSVTETDVLDAMAALVGTYEQEVPAYSAAKHQGKPLYELVRNGLETPVKKKMVTISWGEVELVDLPHVRFRVRCSSGTYIRSLAHSLGNRLGCGAMLEELTREYSHPFGMERAYQLDTLFAAPEGFADAVISIADALPDWHKVHVSDKDVRDIQQGRPVGWSIQRAGSEPFAPERRTVLLTEQGDPVALAITAVQNGQEVWLPLRGLWTTSL